jgi:ketosteroid isomerase-like protein
MSGLPTAEEVVKAHVEAVRQADVERMLADYARDAVVDIHPGLFEGTQALRRMCEVVAAVSGIGTFEAEVQAISPEVVLERWTLGRGTPAERSGTDVVVVRSGKIVFQAARPTAS